MDDLDRALETVGPRLRALRRKRETTLADLSATTGISVSTLSQLESGAPPTGDPRIHLRPITRHGRTMVPLTRRAGGIQTYKLVIPADSSRGEPDPQTHEGYEWLYVRNGRLRLVLGEHDLVLVPGEATEFDTRVPHWFGAADAAPVEFHSLFGKQGERAHLRARPASKIVPHQTDP
ncbi:MULTISPECIES: helix-turn-helix domain-containing protein [unclassified Rhodococcus (in: high G+C Gram-positive bacteria)]|uniref:helix-turn-helix domain-containing protein n=1 Tax=unclassified Rhodococcus (in: high G+C Gram-positive bacteria) TaxID=192944 RepID=UPI00092B0D65|nr:XRE family transcriptional regulator [Rhodococcus sp. M8]OLL17847.1 XRE family transcriptional regulator [Rhodococcus sp. M8]QPG46121.1 cupin domain-containing protein [Rhodococcus sp. M8]